MTPASRRGLLNGAGAAIGAACLGACGQTSKTPSTGAGTIAAADVPVGSGVVVGDTYYIVTQPTAGVFKAFNRACTHAGCPINKVADKEMICTCHGSKFSITDGSVLAGPAQTPLPEVKVTKSGDTLTITG